MENHLILDFEGYTRTTLSNLTAQLLEACFIRKFAEGQVARLVHHKDVATILI